MLKSKLKWKVYSSYNDVRFGYIKEGEYTSKEITLEDAMRKTVIALSTIPVSVVDAIYTNVYTIDAEQPKVVKSYIHRIEPLKVNVISGENMQKHLKFNKAELEKFLTERKKEPFNSYSDLNARVSLYPDKWEHFFSEVSFNLT